MVQITNRRHWKVWNVFERAYYVMKDIALGFHVSCLSLLRSDNNVPWKCGRNILRNVLISGLRKHVSVRTTLFTYSRVLRLRRNTHWQGYANSDSLLSCAGSGHLGKGWIVRVTNPRSLPYWANGLFYPSRNWLCRFTGSSVADCQALTWHFNAE